MDYKNAWASVFPQVVRDLQGIEALKPDYEQLLRATGNTLPFALHDWHLTWCEHFLNAYHGLYDEVRFHVLRDPAGKCVAIVPLIASTRGVGVVKFKALNLLGADPGLTELRASLVAPGYEHLAAHAVRSALRSESDWHWIQWTGARDEFYSAVAPADSCVARNPLQTYVLDLQPSWEEFRAGLKRNIRESLRHCYNSLKRGGHVFEFEVITDPLDIRPALDRFLTLHGKRATMPSTRRHANRFGNRICRQFLYAVCARLAANGIVRIFQFRVDGEVVAMRIGFVVEDSLYLYFSGYEPAWSRYSVMTTTVAEAIKYAIANGLKTVNLSPGEDVSKTRWGPRMVPYPLSYERNRSLSSQWAGQAYITYAHGTSLAARFLRRVVTARRRWDLTPP